MRCSKIGLNGVRIIQVISFGIEVRVRDPVVNILQGLTIAPEQFYTLRIAITTITNTVYYTIVIAAVCFYQLFILFIKSLNTQCIIFAYPLVVGYVVSSLCINQVVICITTQKIIFLRFLIKDAIS